MKRRGNGEGCIVADTRGNGKYIGRLQIGFNSNGKPKIKTFSGKSPMEVRKKIEQYKKEMKNLDTNKNADGLLIEGLTLWLQTQKKPYLKPTSYDRLTQTIENCILPYLGNHAVKSIDAQEIQLLITNLKEKGLSYSSIKKAKEALNGYFKQLVIERKLPYNPVDGVKLPSRDDFAIKEKKALTENEIEKFVKTAASTYASTNEYRYKHGFGAVFILYTGLREGEALALQYKHIDFKNRTVRIEQNLVMVTDGTGDKHRYPLIQKSAKTSAGVRVVPLCDKAFDAILKHKELYYSGNEDDFIFMTESGSHITPHNLTKSVNAMFKAAEIDASGLHILRHSFASWLFEKGVDVKLISRILGHAGVQITYDTYIHENIEQLREAVENL